MKKLLMIALTIFTTTTILYGSEEEIIPPYEITISADAGKQFGEVTVKIETNKKREDLKITSISLQINGEWKSVPAAAFSDLKDSLLYTTQIRTEVGYDKNPWLYIYFELAYRDENNKWNPKKVNIAYHAEKFEYRSITTPTADGRSRWDKKEL